MSTRSFGCVLTCSRLARRPPDKSSITRTSRPFAKSASTMWLPMKPAPPVTTAI